MAEKRKDTLALVKSWSIEFDSISDRIRQLIGESHWLSDGKHKESILMNFLRKYTLDSFVYSSGFIVSHDIDSPQSGEIDILVASPQKGVPWFVDSGILIAPPESIVAHIHVKSNYQKKALEDIFNSICKANLSLSKNDSNPSVLDDIWSSGFFFSQQTSPNLTLIEEHIKSCSKDLKSTLFLPNAIFIHPDISIIINRSTDQEATVKIIKSEKLCVALFLCHFFESITKQTSSEIGDLLFTKVADSSSVFTLHIGKGN